MQVQNTTDKYQGFTVRTNPTATIEFVDVNGNNVTKNALPTLTSVRIPPLATVEIGDDIWEAALLVRSKRQKIDLAKDPITIGSDRKEKKDNVEHFITTPLGDGVWRSYYPVREMVKQGIFKVVVSPKLKLSLDEMRKAITEEQGFALPKEVEESVLVSHYHKLFG